MSDMARMESQRNTGGAGKTKKAAGKNRSGTDVTAAQHAAHKAGAKKKGKK